MSLFFVALSLLKKDKNQSWKLGQEEVEVKSSIQNLPSNIQFLPKDQRPTVKTSTELSFEHISFWFV